MHTLRHLSLVSSFLLVSTLLVQAQEEKFSGPYVGLQGGIAHTKDKFKDDYAITKEEASIGRLGTGFGVFGGYGQVLNDQFYLGIEGYYSYNSTHYNKDRAVPFPIETEKEDMELEISINNKLKSHSAFGAAVRAGVLVQPNIMLYARLGVERLTTKLVQVTKVGETPDKIDIVSKKPSATLVVPGVGVEFNLAEKINARVEYAFSLGKRFSGAAKHTSHKLSQGRLMIGVSFLF